MEDYLVYVSFSSDIVNELLIFDVSVARFCPTISILDDFIDDSGQFMHTFELFFQLEPPRQGVTVIPSTALVINTDPSGKEVDIFTTL